MESTSTIPVLVRSGMEVGISNIVDKSPPSIEDPSNRGGPISPPTAVPKGMFIRVFLSPGPPLKCSPAPQMRPSVDLQGGRMT